MNKKLLCFLGGALLLSNIHAQNNTKPLTIGDKVPDIVLNNIVNYKASIAKLSDFGNKVVIIDFFATWCTSCIAALPHLDSLQKQFGDSVQVFVVSYEPKEKLLSFLQRNKTAKTINTAFITNDTLLLNYFPHKLIPHEVILQNGKVRAITYPEYITEKSIDSLLANQYPLFPLKQDMILFKRDKTLEQNADMDSKILFRSLFSSYVDGFGGKSGLQVKNGRKRLFFTNFPVITLYLSAVGMEQSNLHNRIILEVKDTANYILSEADAKEDRWHAWGLLHAYCYELTVPDTTRDVTMHGIMRQDLDRYLSLQGRIERRKIKCIVLSFKTPTDTLKIKSKGGEPGNRLDAADSVKVIRNQPMSVLSDALNRQVVPLPLRPVFIDETGFKGNADIELAIKNITDVPSLSKALSRYGISVTSAERYMDMLVITEKGYHK